MDIVSIIVVGFCKANIMGRVNGEVLRVNIVALHDHVKYFGLMHGALLHEVNDLILHIDRLIDVVVQLHLQLVLQLSILLQKDFVIDRVREILVIFSQEMEFAVVGPGVPLVPHGVLRPNAHIFAPSEQKKLVDLLVEVFPVEDVGEPGEAVRAVEEGKSDVPVPHEGVHKEDVPTEGHEAVVHAVGVLEVDRRVLDVVARVEKQLTLAVELNRLRWLVHLVCALKILVRSLSQLSVGCVNYFVQVVDLSEAASGRHSKHAQLRLLSLLRNHQHLLVSWLAQHQRCNRGCPSAQHFSIKLLSLLLFLLL